MEKGFGGETPPPEKISEKQSELPKDELAGFMHFDASPEIIESAKNVIAKNNIRKNETEKIELVSGNINSFTPGTMPSSSGGEYKPMGNLGKFFEEHKDAHLYNFNLHNVLVVYKKDGNVEIYPLAERW